MGTFVRWQRHAQFRGRAIVVVDDVKVTRVLEGQRHVHEEY
jgi:hypothetical protein